MPVPKGTLTSYIVKNIQHLVEKYNRDYGHYNRDYNFFLKQRTHLFASIDRSFNNLLHDLRFSDQLRNILDSFGMNTRHSKLVSSQRFLDTMSQIGFEFDLLESEQIRLHTLDLHQIIHDQTVFLIIKKIFNLFKKPGNLTESGGFVIASKTMHFIMPELFIMLDGQHIAVSLYNIYDYHPHPDDGANWFETIPNYSGLKPNPSPRGEGRKSWDYERYSIALMYYKRIFQEWCQHANSNIENFLDIDSQNVSTVKRIIDKALW